MDFKKKLKIRFSTAVVYIVLGILLIIGASASKTKGDFISAFGFSLIIIGIARLKNLRIITKSDESIKRREIIEGDERNIAISTRAKSISFVIYIIISGIAALILSFLGIREIALTISYSVCTLILIYWISYFIIRKNS